MAVGVSRRMRAVCVRALGVVIVVVVHCCILLYAYSFILILILLYEYCRLCRGVFLGASCLCIVRVSATWWRLDSIHTIISISI